MARVLDALPPLHKAVLLAGTNDAMMELAARAGNEGAHHGRMAGSLVASEGCEDA